MSKAITNSQLNEAAKNHAMEQLGQAQFNSNKDAVISIANDFIAGAKFMLFSIEKIDGEVVNLVDKEFEYEH